MVEPLEETRTELIFATEPILSSLELSIPGASRHSPLVELDEVEVLHRFTRYDEAAQLKFIPDPERHPANMQGPFLPPFICAVDTLQHWTGEHHHKQRC